jgi:murein DD-endopeptidase MepM/ murein hydrolase activator NlpD
MNDIEIHRPVAAEFPISSSYGMRTHPLTGERKLHGGIDFATPEGTPVVAALSGVIARAGWEDESNRKKGFGMRVWQRCGQVFICYAHLSQIDVYPGKQVAAGERIGITGNTGASSAPHLHLETRVGTISSKGVEFKLIEKTA